VVLTASAWAEGAPSEAVVEVAAAGDPAVTASMAERVRALGTRLGVSTRWQTRSGIDARDVLSDKRVDAGILARVWLDLSDPKRAVLYIANATHDRFLVRVVPAEGGYGEVTQESLTTIVESVVDALVTGGQIGVDRAEATRKIEEDVGVRVDSEPRSAIPTLVVETPAAAPPRDEGATGSPAPRRDGGHVVVDASYRMDVVASGPSIRQGPQVALSFTRHLSSAVDLLFWFGGHWAPSSTLGDAAEEVRLRGGGGRAAAGVTGYFGSAFGWRVALGGGVDAFGVRARRPFSAALSTRRDGSRFRFRSASTWTCPAIISTRRAAPNARCSQGRGWRTPSQRSGSAWLSPRSALGSRPQGGVSSVACYTTDLT
jgi:hypothetical protein